MPRPPILIVEPAAEKRRALSHDLTAAGYEVVPAIDLAEGSRFAAGLGDAVVVAPLELADGEVEPLLAALAPETGNGSPGRRSVVLLAHQALPDRELPGVVRFVRVDGLGRRELAHRLQVVLLGREIGVEPAVDAESLIGDLALVPLLELVRSLHGARFSGRVAVDEGTVHFDDGEVAAARVGAARGIKAFCRLGRRSEGPVRVIPGGVIPAREIDRDLGSLVIAAIEDSLGDFPHPRSRFRVVVGEALFGAELSPPARRILTIAHRGAFAHQLLDALELLDGQIVDELLRLEEQGLLVREEPLPEVAVFTDSTADLPPELAREHRIEVVPLTVQIGDRRFRDRVDLQPGRFYELLAEGTDHPASSPPEPDEFARRFEPRLADQDVLALMISKRLSLTAEHAEKAVAGLGRSSSGHRATVIDSRLVSLALGLLALFAARMALRGEKAEAIAGRIPGMAARIEALFVVDTLEYLARGGRIGGARAWLGQLLGIKPILGLVDGQVVAVDKVRGGRGAHPRLLELLAARLAPDRPVVAGIVHAKAPVWADRLRALTEERFTVSELIVGDMGPVVGTHAGPGTVGIATFQPTDEEAPLVAPL